MAGTVLVALNTFAGLDLLGDIVRIDPDLPGHWRTLSFNFAFKGVNYRCKVSQEKVMLLADSDVVVEINGEKKHLILGEAADMECPSS